MKLAQLIKDINEDCMARGTYKTLDGRTCAIGYMAIKAGCEDLLPVDQMDLPIYTDDLAPLVDAISAYYELEGWHESESPMTLLNTIQSLNDQHNTPEARREAITEFLLEWCEVEA